MKKSNQLLLDIRDAQQQQNNRLHVIESGLQTLIRSRSKVHPVRVQELDTTIAALRAQLEEALARLQDLEKQKQAPAVERPFNPLRDHCVRTVVRNALARNIDHADMWHLTYDKVREITGIDVRELHQGGENHLDVAERMGLLNQVLFAARTCLMAPINSQN